MVVIAGGGKKVLARKFSVAGHQGVEGRVNSLDHFPVVIDLTDFIAITLRIANDK